MLIRAIALSPLDWFDFAVASTELALARVRLLMSNHTALLQPPAFEARCTDRADVRVERVRIAIARASSRLPWRTDCLVQALAAQHWLRRLGVETSLSIGVPRNTEGQFEAHAWLTHRDVVITGGDISRYVPLKGTELSRFRKS